MPQPLSEGRMRAQEDRSRWERANETKVARSVPKSVPRNPFDSDYDEEKNPFGADDDEEFDEKNPFGKAYCDKNLNPFEE